eukprot:gene8943-biopygen4621
MDTKRIRRAKRAGGFYGVCYYNPRGLVFATRSFQLKGPFGGDLAAIWRRFGGHSAATVRRRRFGDGEAGAARGDRRALAADAPRRGAWVGGRGGARARGGGGGGGEAARRRPRQRCAFW